MKALRRVAYFFAITVASASIVAAGHAETPATKGTLSEAQQKEIQELIHTYLMDNPEVIIEAVQKYQTEQAQKAQEEAHAALVANKDKLEKDTESPVAGNPKGDVTVVEFFDYNCGYCKKMLPAVQELLSTDKNVRYVFKDLPILRPDSERAAKAALAVWNIAPDKYFEYHVALMGGRGELTDERLLKTAETLGINREKLKAAMEDPALDKIIQRNLDMARVLGIGGTPAFIIGDQMLPGALGLDALQQVIAKSRAG